MDEFAIEQAAAIAVAIQSFARDTAPTLSAPPRQPDRWRRVAMMEAVCRENELDIADPWINT
jgi:hypothetical protein